MARTLARLVKVSAWRVGVEVDVFHNAVLDVPTGGDRGAGRGERLQRGRHGLAGRGARGLPGGGEVKMVQVRTASVDLVAREVFGADATIDFLKIDVEGVEIVIMADVRSEGIRLTV